MPECNSKPSLLSEYRKRLSHETPFFFRKLRVFGVQLIAIAGAVTAPELINAPVKMPEMLITMSHYVFTIGAVIVAVASAACSNPPEQQ